MRMTQKREWDLFYLDVYILSVMLTCGVSIMRCAALLQENGKLPETRRVFEEVVQKLLDKETFTRSLSSTTGEMWQQQIVIGLIRAGEVSGTIDETAVTIAQWVDLKRQFYNDKKPWYQKVIGFCAKIFDTVNTSEKIVTGEPTLQQKAFAVFTLSKLLSSCVPMLQALETVAEATENVVIRDALLATKEQVRDANSKRIVESDFAELFDPYIIQLICIGEETGALDVILMKAYEVLMKTAEIENSEN